MQKSWKKQREEGNNPSTMIESFRGSELLTWTETYNVNEPKGGMETCMMSELTPKIEALQQNES